jgi:hypothetical protein
MNTEKKILNSIDKKHKIEIMIIDNLAWFNIINIEYENYKTFLDLLKDTINIFNKNNVEYIKQYVYSDDIQYFKLSEYTKIDDNCYIMTTKLKDFPAEIFDVLGVNKI